MTPSERIAEIEARHEQDGRFFAHALARGLIEKNGYQHMADIDRAFLLEQLKKAQASRAEVIEECAAIVDAERDRVLSKQSGKPDFFSEGVDRNIRMVAVLFPDVASSIRALKEKA